MSTFNLNEFNTVSAAAWKQKIQVDLKGDDYNQTLLWKTNNLITVKPFYNEEDCPKKIKIRSNTWNICQFIDCTSEAKQANQKAIAAISKGAESIVFLITKNTDLKDLVKNIDVETNEIHFLLDRSCSLTTIASLVQIFKHENYHLNIDPIGHLALTGNCYKNISEDLKVVGELIQHKGNQFKLAVDTRVYQNAGASIVQQLAYASAHLNEYLNLAKETKHINIQFVTATGSDYFFEIAKIRALKLLCQSIAKSYNIKLNIKIISSPSNRNKTLYDYNVNMLRTSTECMSAILGGANTIFNLPYDHIYHNSNDFGDRISRNQLLVLKNEADFGKVTNTADGSYYIESLTKQLAEKALDIFKEIEKGGGFLKQLKECVIQRKIKEQAAIEQKQFDDKTLVLLGTNKYPNMQDRMKHELEKKPFLQKIKRKTLLQPIVARRIAEKAEIKRLYNEK